MQNLLKSLRLASDKIDIHPKNVKKLTACQRENENSKFWAEK
jgi:hypothetical protein